MKNHSAKKDGCVRLFMVNLSLFLSLWEGRARRCHRPCIAVVERALPGRHIPEGDEIDHRKGVQRLWGVPTGRRGGGRFVAHRGRAPRLEGTALDAPTSIPSGPEARTSALGGG